LFVNERSVNIHETRNFGCLGAIEVGALSVGRIAQVQPLHVPFRRGEEKADFRFGGSAIVVFGERGKWYPSADLIEHRRNNVETPCAPGEASLSLARSHRRSFIGKAADCTPQRSALFMSGGNYRQFQRLRVNKPRTEPDAK
jgi:hypothetical protein